MKNERIGTDKNIWLPFSCAGQLELIKIKLHTLPRPRDKRVYTLKFAFNFNLICSIIFFHYYFKI